MAAAALPAGEMVLEIQEQTNFVTVAKRRQATVGQGVNVLFLGILKSSTAKQVSVLCGLL